MSVLHQAPLVAEFTASGSIKHCGTNVVHLNLAIQNAVFTNALLYKSIKLRK